MPTIAVSGAEVEQFDIAVALACAYQSENRFEFEIPADVKPSEAGGVPDYFYSRDGCLVISFDCTWYPFLDNTRGYNRGPERWYMPKMSSLLAAIALAMQAPDQKRFSRGRSGGRVFVHSTGVIRRPAVTQDLELLSWKLPSDSYFLRDRHIQPGG